MSTLSPSGLETADYGAQGWNAIYSSNFQKLNDKLGHPMSAASVPGTIDVANNAGSADDPDPVTAQALTDSSGGSASQTIGAVSGSGADAQINDNFASLTDEVNKLRNDLVEARAQLIAAIDYSDSLKTTLNNVLAGLRKTTGVGIFSN